jgi:GDP-4-dehydro-6-deoxy-D-mannose reductase
MKILITGSTGLVGKALVKELEKNNIFYIIFDRNFSDILNINDWLKYDNIDFVIHLASKTSVKESWEKPLDVLSFNINSTLCALEFCRIKSSKLIFLSSFLYKSKIGDFYKENDKLFANNPYAKSKLECESLINFYSINFGLIAIIFRPFNIYGYGQSESFLLGRIFSQISKSNIINIENDTSRRDFIYILDIVLAIVKILNINPKSSDVFNLGTGISYSVGEVLDLIKKVSNTKFEVNNQKIIRKNEILNTISDSTKFFKVSGWRPIYNLEDGIKEILNLTFKRDF